MPKRVIDGEALWQSHKLSQVQPEKYRGELANLLPLMSVNGSFEADARLIWSQVYGFNRPKVTLKDVEAMLKEFERVKILFRWTAEDGKVWGYFVGAEKAGRLPPPSKRYSDAASADIPEELLAAFIGAKLPRPYRGPTQPIPEAYPGIGNGLSKGSGLGLGSINSSSVTHIDTDIGSGFENTDSVRHTTSAVLESEQEDEENSFDKDSETEAEQLAMFFHELVQSNPHLGHITPKWQTLWVNDFTRLLQDYSFEECRLIIKVSQRGNWQKYIIRPFSLLKHADEIWKKAKKVAHLFEDEPDEEEAEDDDQYEDEEDPAMDDDNEEEEEEGDDDVS
jgi:hypothetical protein